jgi:hypothetical protein
MRWSTPMSGAGAPGPSPEAGAAVDASGQVVASVDVYRVEMSHDGGYMLFVPPPQSGWHAVGLQGGPYLAY